MSLKRSTKFVLGISVIVCIAVGSMSLFFYHYVKTLYIQETYQKTDLVLGHIDAIMEYIKDELRPKMFELLPRDEFVREAMSTSFVNKGVMSRFSKLFPDYVYRRVAVNPMNPQNRADALEAKFIREFSANRENGLDWKGTVSRQGRRYFIHLKGVVMEKQCAVCHGAPSDSPQSLLDRYGGLQGHNWRVGDVVGLESIAIPIDSTFFRIRQVAVSIFLIGLAGTAGLTLFLYYFYYFVTQRPLMRISSFFKSIVNGQEGLDVRLEVKGQDEITDLADSFNGMIDHLRQSQEAVVASESKYRRIFEGSKDAIVVADRGRVIRDINNAGLELLGFDDRTAVIGRVRLQDLFESKASSERFFGLLEATGVVKDFETVCCHPAGGKAHVLITATVGSADPADETRYECTIKDITERKKMELQLRQADRLASIGQLAAGVAHEINNPLSIVIGYTKMLRQDAVEPSLAEDLDIISANAGTCKKIVEDLLNFSRQTKTQRSEVDIHEILESVLAVVETNFADDDVTIRRAFDPALPPVVVDVGKMRQVFMNLILNAYQSIEGGGRITIATRDDAARDGFWITVSDTGVGIPDDARELIFDPFFTTKEPGQGTGLGLAVSYGIVQEHSGDISFESEEGQGATFTIWLPKGTRDDETDPPDRR
jgi:PAS domain S-box-containing protein